jgi:hypothetical protein
VLGPRVGRRLCAIAHAVVAQDLNHSQAVVLEDAAAARCLRGAMRFQVTPLLQPPPRRARREKGQELAFLREALEPLDRHETVYLLQQRLQLGRQVEIVLAAALMRPELEDDGDHAGSPKYGGARIDRGSIAQGARQIIEGHAARHQGLPPIMTSVVAIAVPAA